MSTDTSRALDQPTMTAPTPKPPRDKVMRIATMTKHLLDEIRTQPLDTAGLKRLRAIDSHIIGELLTVLTPDLREELQRLTLPLTHQAELSDAELRLAHAQLVGWLQGLLKTTHTALSDPHAVPVADWITGQAAEDAPTSSDIPTSPNHPDRPHLEPSNHLPGDVPPDRTMQPTDQHAKHCSPPSPDASHNCASPRLKPPPLCTSPARRPPNYSKPTSTNSPSTNSSTCSPPYNSPFKSSPRQHTTSDRVRPPTAMPGSPLRSITLANRFAGTPAIRTVPDKAHSRHIA